MESNPLEGKVETDENASYLSELVAYKTLNELADDINRILVQIDDFKSSKGILLVNELNYALNDLPRIEVSAQLDHYGTSMEKQVSQNEKLLQSNSEAKILEGLSVAAGAIAAIPGVISFAANIAGYFKTDYTIKGRVFDANNEGIIAAIAGKLQNSERNVYLNGFFEMDKSEILRKFIESQHKSEQLRMSSSRLSNEIVKPISDNTSTLSQSDQSRIEDAKRAINDSEVILAGFDSLSKSITTVPEGEIYSKLAKAILREKITQPGIDLVLYLNMISSGGQGITIDKLIRNDTMRYLGGIAVTYILAKKSGEVIASDMLTRLSAYDYKLKGDASKDFPQNKLKNIL